MIPKFSREYKKESIVEVDGVKIGKDFTIMAGPCAVENEEQIMMVAEFLAEMGIKILRGGAYKPRTSPYSFQGLGKEGLKLLRRAADEYGLLTITEVLNSRDVELVAQYADILQIGSRNSQNYELLRAIGKCDRPAVLKRGFGNTIKELLYSAEYILNEGNEKVILCERGIRTFEPETRFTLDIAAVPVVKEMSHLPIIVDPSHPAGKRSLVAPLAKAAYAVGAHGIMVEVHPQPEKALSDSAQQLNFQEFKGLLKELEALGWKG